MDSDRNKQVAVVTGASSGIGLETSLLLARNGSIILVFSPTRLSNLLNYG